MKTSTLTASDIKAGRSKVFTIKHAQMHVDQVRNALESARLTIDSIDRIKQETRLFIKNFDGKNRTSFEDTHKLLKSDVENIFSEFSKEIFQQKLQNEKLMQKIVEMKKQRTEMQQLIVAAAKKCAQLETELGKYPK